MNPDIAKLDRIGLGILCKAPRAGSSKTRIGAIVGHETAAALAAAFLRDVALTVSRVAASGLFAPVAFFRPAGSEQEIERCVGPDIPLVPQTGDDLGAIMETALNELIALHPKGAILIGADLPTLPPEVIAAAGGHLLRPGKRVVFGPATDGGFYLIATNTNDLGQLLAPTAWSTPQVMQTMRERSALEGLEVAEVASWADVDTVEDLDRITAELEHIDPENAVHTRAVLMSLRQG